MPFQDKFRGKNPHESGQAHDIGVGRLKNIMKDIHDQCVQYGQESDRVDYFKGANIAGFVKVANAMCVEYLK